MRDLDTIILVALMRPVFALRKVEKPKAELDIRALERLICALSVARQYLPTAPLHRPPTNRDCKASEQTQSTCEPHRSPEMPPHVFLCLCGGETQPAAAGVSESKLARDWVRENYSSTYESLGFILDHMSQDTLQNVIYARREIDRYLGEVRAHVIAVSSSWHLRFFEAVRLVFNESRFLLATAAPACDPSTHEYEIVNEQKGLRIFRESLQRAQCQLEEAPAIYHRLRSQTPPSPAPDPAPFVQFIEEIGGLCHTIQQS
jgi:hypothetical protein